MKKFLLFPLAFLFTACGSDKSTGTTIALSESRSNIDGTWLLSKVTCKGSAVSKADLATLTLKDGVGTFEAKYYFNGGCEKKTIPAKTSYPAAGQVTITHGIRECIPANCAADCGITDEAETFAFSATRLHLILTKAYDRDCGGEVVYEF